MTGTVVYQAIYKDEKFTVSIEYIPLQNGAIEIVNFDIQQKPVSQWEERQKQPRRKRGMTAEQEQELLGGKF